MSRTHHVFSIFATMMLLAACGEQLSQDEHASSDGRPDARSYVVLDESLKQLKDDFNANKGKVRLLFIVGDTCGICLRGMADLNDVFIARAQNDERLLTMVVHVPTLGAQEKHIPDALPLLDGPRVLHYWDGVGKSGVHIGETLGTHGVYAWDVWLAYGPETEWLETVPPGPAFWMHQLGPLDPDLRLDDELFAEKTLALMNSIEEGDLAELTEEEATLLADGTVISTVAQPHGVAIQTHLMGKGGFHNIKGIETITQRGMMTWDTGSTTLEVRQDQLDGLSRSYGDPEHPLAGDIDKILADTWQMHGPIFRWKHRGHQVQMDGMLKVGNSLAWKLLLTRQNGTSQVFYIDSHNGDIVLETYQDVNGETVFSIRSGDFREVDGFRYPFKIEYLDADGTVIASETYDDIEIINFSSDVPADKDA